MTAKAFVGIVCCFGSSQSLGQPLMGTLAVSGHMLDRHGSQCCCCYVCSHHTTCAGRLKHDGHESWQLVHVPCRRKVERLGQGQGQDQARQEVAAVMHLLLVLEATRCVLWA